MNSSELLIYIIIGLVIGICLTIIIWNTFKKPTKNTNNNKNKRGKIK